MGQGVGTVSLPCPCPHPHPQLQSCASWSSFFLQPCGIWADREGKTQDGPRSSEHTHWLMEVDRKWGKIEKAPGPSLVEPSPLSSGCPAFPRTSV